MWLVEHEWKLKGDAVRPGGATSYHDAKYTTEAKVDAEVERLLSLPDVAWARKTVLYAEPDNHQLPPKVNIEQALRQVDEHFPGAFWLLGKGKASAAEKLYGFQVLFGTDEVLSDGEADDPVSAILAAIENGKSRQSRTSLE